MTEECVEFFNEEKIILRGIIHKSAENSDKKIGIIILNTGLNDMVGWHRIQVDVARYLATNGFTVLRFDNFGIGDSDGELEDEDVPLLLSKIETGIWQKDTKSAILFLKDRIAPQKIYLLGFCGGAINAIFAAINFTNYIDGIINIAAPFTLSKKLEIEKLNPYNTEKNFRIYVRKFYDLNAIKNFFMGKSDYKDVIRTIFNYLKLKIKGSDQIIQEISLNDENSNATLNRKLVNAVMNLPKTNLPALFYYPEHDAATWEFENLILTSFKKSDYFLKKIKYIKLEGANHTFADIDSQEHLIRDILSWLEKQQNETEII